MRIRRHPGGSVNRLIAHREETRKKIALAEKRDHGDKNMNCTNVRERGREEKKNKKTPGGALGFGWTLGG